MIDDKDKGCHTSPASPRPTERQPSSDEESRAFGFLEMLGCSVTYRTSGLQGRDERVTVSVPAATRAKTFTGATLIGATRKAMAAGLMGVFNPPERKRPATWRPRRG